MLNKQKGNMYDFGLTHTYNVIKGACSHDCEYCYMKRWGALKTLRFDDKELKTDLGNNNFIFVGSSTDMFAKDVPTNWIEKVLEHLKAYPNNKYLLQTKNPERYLEFMSDFEDLNLILATTMESSHSNLIKEISKAPAIVVRSLSMQTVKYEMENKNKTIRTMITIEPIMDFDLELFLSLLTYAEPNLIAIGANTSKIELKEPSKDKLNLLIKELKNNGIEVYLKPNLNRLIK